IVRVQWSRDGHVDLPGWTAGFNPFLSHSYVVRVTFRSGDRVLVALPPGSARKPPTAWHEQVVARALELYEAGEVIGRLGVTYRCSRCGNERWIPTGDVLPFPAACEGQLS